MAVVRDSERSPNERQRALNELSSLSRNLNGHPCIDELASLYNVASVLEKQAMLNLFMGSDDPKGIPVFLRTVEHEENMKLRLAAAAALAQWNVRRGVAELVKLMDSKDSVPQPSRMFFVYDNAIDLFEIKNRLKGWGFPAEDVRKSIEARPGLDREQFVALYSAEVKKWFAENEHRFPDWKLGDPLPAIEPDKESNR
jgi:hypothetical protein